MREPSLSAPDWWSPFGLAPSMTRSMNGVWNVTSVLGRALAYRVALGRRTCHRQADDGGCLVLAQAPAGPRDGSLNPRDGPTHVSHGSPMRWDGSHVARDALRNHVGCQKWILRIRQGVPLDPWMNRRWLGHTFARRVRVSRGSMRASHCMREGIARDARADATAFVNASAGRACRSHGIR